MVNRFPDSTLRRDTGDFTQGAVILEVGFIKPLICCSVIGEGWVGRAVAEDIRRVAGNQSRFQINNGSIVIRQLE